MSESLASRRVQCNNYMVGLIWLVLAEPETKDGIFLKHLRDSAAFILVPGLVPVNHSQDGSFSSPGFNHDVNHQLSSCFACALCVCTFKRIFPREMLVLPG